METHRHDCAVGPTVRCRRHRLASRTRLTPSMRVLSRIGLKPFRSVVPCALLMLLIACAESREPQRASSSGRDASSDAAAIIGSAGPAIGAACRASDFDEADDLNTLPAGKPYCLTGPLYPDGYVTANCSADRDCRDAACDGEKCRKPCAEDADCAEPAVCRDAEGIKWCQCVSCAEGIRM